jgi:hypothetical protein
MRNKYGVRPGRATWPLLLAAFLLLAGGCAWPRSGGRTVNIVAPDFFGIGEELAVQLTAGLRQPLGNNGRLIMSTMVDIDDLYRTTRFGRTLTEAMATRLFRHGFGVIEVRRASELLIKSQGGELILSRDAKLLAGTHNAVALVAGTYALTPDTVIVNVRFIDAGGQDVLSVAGIEIERSRAINALLSSGADSGGGDGGDRPFELSGYER